MQRKLGKTWLIVLLAGLATYSLAGFLIAPWAIKYWVENAMPTEPGFRLRVQGVYLNPFTFFLSFTDVTLIQGENKRFVSIRTIETRLWSIRRDRNRQPGREAEIRDLRVAIGPDADVSFTAPILIANGVVVDASEGTASIASARLASPVLRFARDASGDFRLPAWLPVPGDSSRAGRVSFGTVDISGGQVQFADRFHSPALRFDADDIVGRITGPRQRGASAITAELEGRLGDASRIDLIARWHSADRGGLMDFHLALGPLDVSRLSPYFASTVGRGIAAGTGDLAVHYERRETTARMTNRFAVGGLRLADRVTTSEDGGRPLELALALVTDATDRIDLSIPVVRTGITSTPDVPRLIAESMTQYVVGLTATPFDALARIVGHPSEDLDSIPFPAGNAEIASEAEETIALIVRALAQRPLLGVEMRPSYAAVADRDAIAEQQVRLHVALATSAKDRYADARPDFEDPKVRDILDEFADTRLTESQRRAISSGSAEKEAEYYRRVYDSLIANESVSDTVLRRLARFRARSVIDAISKNGIDRERLTIADTIDMATADDERAAVRLEAYPRVFRDNKSE